MNGYLASECDPILLKYHDYIENHAYITVAFPNAAISNPPVDGYYSSRVSTQGFSPSPLISSSINYHSVNTSIALDPLTQLYSARGGQGFGMD